MSRRLDFLAGGDGGSRIVEVPIEERMEQAFLDYAMSVIVGRALPDVRDGLKPVQRRILFSMWESRLLPDRPYRKCASAVGEVMKKYHPHGDASIYDALVRMAQDFSTREPLIDGHGNFGSVDGDPPAAMRYTEARLSPVALALLDGIEEDTVDFVANYDGYEREPVVLPARVPNLLVNGGTGIAVGMATNIPPHNLGETIDATLLLLANADTSLDELMKRVPAPDFPTGARIIATDGIREAYATGRGAITLEAVATTEVRSGKLPRIIVTEIPYQVNKAALLAKVAALVQSRKLEQIRDLRDESSRDGMRIVIELKRGEDPAAVLAKLFDLTELRTNFNVNTVALVDGAPRTLGLRECLLAYIAHQRGVLTRRTRHRREKAAARAHILEGLLKALDHLDEVIALIRAAESAEAAKGELVSRLELTDTQAQAVLDMQLRRLAALERSRLREEYDELLQLMAELDAILADPARLDGLLGQELTGLKRAHATPRRSRLVASGISAGDVLAGGSRAGFDAQPVTVFVTAGGYLKPIAQRRTSPAHAQAHDPAVAILRCTTHDGLLLIDEQGMGYRVDLDDVPVVRARDRGTPASAVLGEAPAARLVGAVVLSDAPDATLVTVSEQGRVKRTPMPDYGSHTWSGQAAGLKEGDRIAAVATCRDDDELLVAHSGGLIIRFPARDVRSMGRTASGVTAMDVPPRETVVSLTVATDAAESAVYVVTVAGDGTAKRTPLDEYPVQGRGGKGVQTGARQMVWCGIEADLHVHGEPPVVVRPVELTESRRTGKGQPLDVTTCRMVVAETASQPAS